MSDIKFVNGMKAFRAKDAPDWALTKLTVYRREMLEILQQETDDVLYWEVLRSRKGKTYIKYDPEGKAYAERVAKEGMEKAKQSVTGTHPVSQEFPEDDIPF